MYNDTFFSYLGLYSNTGDEASPGTPRQLANEMLDKLPTDLWSDPNKTFLDPSMTNGMFYFLLVERLFYGLSDKIPCPKARISHILTKQVWGYEMNKSPFEYVEDMLNQQFDIGVSIDVQPNIYCSNIIEKELNMKFDVVVMNPPYQMSSGKSNASKAIYHKFVEMLDEHTKDYMIALMPARWHTGGQGMSKFRKNILSRKDIEMMKVYPDSKVCFPDNDIKGGICYFVINKNYSGECSIYYVDEDEEHFHKKFLSVDGKDILISDKRESSILLKVAKKKMKSVSDLVSCITPFDKEMGRLAKLSTANKSIALYGFGLENKYVEMSDIKKNHHLVDKWKVLVPKAADGRGGNQISVLTTPLVVPPKSVCTETYLVIGAYDDEAQAKSMAN